MSSPQRSQKYQVLLSDKSGQVLTKWALIVPPAEFSSVLGTSYCLVKCEEKERR